MGRQILTGISARVRSVAEQAGPSPMYLWHRFACARGHAYPAFSAELHGWKDPAVKPEEATGTAGKPVEERRLR